MPLNAGRSGAFAGLILFSVLGATAQTTPPTTTQPTTPPRTTASPVAAPSTPPINLPSTAVLPSAADVMRARIGKAKAYVAVKNYTAAIYELEGIRRESNDASVNSVTQVMLLNCYLEQMDYKRAQNFLTEVYEAQKANKPNFNYFAVAAQVVKGARSQLDRYKSLGLSIADRNLPVEAAADVNKMRETVEMVVTQSKTLGETKKLTADSMALLEEASNARSSLARDDYDARRWKEEMADARESLMSSKTTVINGVEDTMPNVNLNNTMAVNANPGSLKTTENSTAQVIPAVAETQTQNQSPVPPEMTQTTSAPNNNSKKSVETSKETTAPAATQLPPPNQPKLSVPLANSFQPAENKPANKDTSPLAVGSLVEYATEKASPTYPPAARMMRKTGTVRVEVLINEQGKIEDVKNTSGESLLQRAAVDALKKWKFKPFMRDGQPVKATGYVNFNFNL